MPMRKSARHKGVIIFVTGARREACNIETIVGLPPMSNLISTPISSDLRLLPVGEGASELAGLLGAKESDLDSADAALFLVSAKNGASQNDQDSWLAARELYIPSIVVITDLVGAELDFDDMSAIVGKQLDPVVTPFLVLHSDEGEPAALIDLDALTIREISAGSLTIRESEGEHKVLVFEFRKEYLEAIEASGEGAFEQGLMYPALPYVAESGLGLNEIAEYLNLLPVRS
jgi:hypothetical protein